MKLQRVRIRHGSKLGHRYVVAIPDESIESLGWEAGNELRLRIINKEIKISCVSRHEITRQKNSGPKMTYAEFRDRIRALLEHKDNGLTWPQIRDELGLEQVVPDSKWVRQMEKDAGLTRVQDIRGVIWRIAHV